MSQATNVSKMANEAFLEIACNTPLPEENLQQAIASVFSTLAAVPQETPPPILYGTSTSTPKSTGTYPTTSPSNSGGKETNGFPMIPSTNSASSTKDSSKLMTTFFVYLEDPIPQLVSEQPVPHRTTRRPRPASFDIFIDGGTAKYPPANKRARTDGRTVLGVRNTTAASPIPNPRDPCDPFSYDSSDPNWENLENYELVATTYDATTYDE